MRRLLSLLAVLALVVSCTSAPNTLHPHAPATVAELSRATVALVGMSETGEAHPYCTGTWITATEILTAAHCVDDDGDISWTVSYRVTEDGLTHQAGVIKVDPIADLALLRDVWPPLHASTPVALWAPAQGSEVHVLGHLRGLWWTYLHGYVAASERQYETTLGIEGPFLQLEAPIAPGSSGGGAFTLDGELVGVCSFTRRDVPNEGFFIHTTTIRKFLLS